MRPLNQENLKDVFLHCSDTPVTMDIGADEIRNWHVNERGWSDIGYHYVIRRNGEVERGRDVKYDGAHAFGHNDDSLSVCLVGGRPFANFTLAQYNALVKLVFDLEVAFDRNLNVVPHYEVDSGKTCPTFDPVALFQFLEE